MNTYIVCKTRTYAVSPEHSALLSALKNAAALCLSVTGCALLADCRLAAAALGGAVMLLGCILILSSSRIRFLLLGTGTASTGVLLTAWSVWRMVTRQPIPVGVHGHLTGLLIQLCFLAGGIAFITVPVSRIDRAARQGMMMVRAQCIASCPDEEYSIWRYRLGGSLYDWEERRCASFFLPDLGEACVLFVDPERPEQAVRIDRRMAAVQILVGVLMIGEVILAAAASL